MAKSRILVVIDPTADTHHGLERAEWLARQNDASLRLFACYYNQFLAGSRFYDSRGLQAARAEVLQQIKDGLERLAQPLRDAGLTVETATEWDQPLYEGIVREAVACNADFVFKETHYHNAAKRVLLTNTDWNLIRTCPQPLWLVKYGEFSSPPRVLAAVDPAHKHEKPAALDDRILETAKTLATDTAGDVYAVHAYEALTAVGEMAKYSLAPTTLPVDELESQLKATHRKQLDELVQYYGIDADKALLSAESPRHALPAVAKDIGASIVVMGAVARNKLQRLFVGSTAEHVMDHLPCDMLVVKPVWFRTPVQLRKGQAAA